MDIQAIRNLVAKKIAGQGTMVDVGGGLPVILNAICDAIEEGGGGGSEPLVVAGTLDGENYFVPNEGQPSHAEAEEAFLNGTPVLLDITDETTPFHKIFSVVNYDVDTKELTAGLYTWL